MISALEALEWLRDGNRRFVSGIRSDEGVSIPARREELVAGQDPFAVVLGCSDSRVPPEMVFDQGLGDLFVVRVAGNIAAPSAVGSVEFAAARLGVRLVVVLGHSGCGAVEAALEEFQLPEEEQSDDLASILDHLRRPVEEVLETGLGDDPFALMDQAVRASVSHTADRLRHDSGVLGELIRSDGLVVVGAEYSLETGVVEFFDGAPEG